MLKTDDYFCFQLFAFLSCCLVAGFNWQELGNRRLRTLPAVCIGLRNKDTSSWPLLAQLQNLESSWPSALQQWTQASVWDREGKMLLQDIWLWKCLRKVCGSESLTFTFGGVWANKVMSCVSLMVCPQPKASFWGRLTWTHWPCSCWTLHVQHQMFHCMTRLELQVCYLNMCTLQ